MQTAGNLVTAGAELTAGMEHGEHRFESTLAGAGMDIGGDATAVIGNAGGAIGMEHHQDLVAVAG